VLGAEDKVSGITIIFADRAENVLHQSGILQIQHSAEVR
jgi:hypothetical protein